MGRLHWLLLLSLVAVCLYSSLTSFADHPSRNTIETTATSAASLMTEEDGPPQLRRRQLREDELLSNSITRYPTKKPTASPTFAPSSQPTESPSTSPTTAEPTASPSISPTTSQPTKSPSVSPTTGEPTGSPSISPTTSSQPTELPSSSPTTAEPTTFPSISPSTSRFPTMSPSESFMPTSAPTQRFPISIFSLIVYTTATSGKKTTTATIDGNELENILETFLLEQVQLELSVFEIKIVQIDLVLVALPKKEEDQTSVKGEYEFILSGDLICTKEICPSTNETEAFILQSISKNVDQVLMLLHDSSNDPMLQSVVDIDISVFTNENNDVVAGANQYKKVEDDPASGGSSKILIPLLTVASLCLALMVSAVVLLYRAMYSMPEEIIGVTGKPSFDSVIVCAESEETEKWRNIKTDSSRTNSFG